MVRDKFFLLTLLFFSIPANSKNLEIFSKGFLEKDNQNFISDVKISSNENLEAVIVTGKGISIEEAIQDASVNALKQVSVN